MSPTISVVTAVFNRVATIAEALDSVRGQTWRDREHIVIDGGSTDGTLAILESRRHELATLVSERDSGVYDALNKGLARCKGDVVGFLHADDVYAGPAVLARIAAVFVDPKVDAVYGDLQYLSARSGRVVRRWRSGPYSRASLSRGWMPPHPTFYARRSLYERLGSFDTRYRIAADYDLMLRFLGHGVQPAYLPEVLVKMRLGGLSNRSLKNILRKSTEDYRALKANGVGGIAALCWKNLGKLGQYF